jgi:hypothetical protein
MNTIFKQIEIEGLCLSIQKHVTRHVEKLTATCYPVLLLGIVEGSEDQWDDMFQSANNAESSIHNSKEEAYFRKSVASSKYLNSGSVFNDKSEFKETISNKMSHVRKREYTSIPLGIVFWICSIAIAYSSNRDELLIYVQNGQWLPDVLPEWCKKVRTADSTNCTVSNTRCSIPKTPDSFKNSILDFEFITTPQGFQFFLDFCNFVGLNEQNYVRGSFVTNNENPIPRKYSGNTFTHCAFNVINWDILTRVATFALLPIHSIAVGTTEVVVYDAAFTNSCLLLENGNQYVDVVSERQDVLQISENTYELYVIQRVCSGLKNSYEPNDHSDDQDGNNNFQKERKPYYNKQKSSRSLSVIRDKKNKTAQKQKFDRDVKARPVHDKLQSLLSYVRDITNHNGFILINDQQDSYGFRSSPLLVLNV